MFVSLNNLGSMVLELRGNELEAKFLRENGAVADSFTIVKGSTANVPSAATGVTATLVSPATIEVTWTDTATNEDGYRIERCSGSACSAFAQIAQLAANATSYSDTDLTATTLYRYRVVAFNGDGSAASQVAEAMTPSQPPAAASALTATAASTSQIDLAWTDNSTSEDGFLIERCSGSACTELTRVAQLAANATTYSDTGLTATTLYRYRVVAYNGAGTAAASNVAEATTKTPPPPAAASGVTAVMASGTQVTLTWSDNATDEDGFLIERCLGTSCTAFTQIGQVSANVTTFADGNVAAAGVYRYRVIASNTGGRALPSNVAEVTVGVPAAPGALSGAASGASAVSLSWTDNAVNETGFQIERCTGNNCTNFVQIVQLGANTRSHVDNAVTRNSFYRYRIRAYNVVGASAYSNIVTVRTPNR
jgi:titin